MQAVWLVPDADTFALNPGRTPTDIALPIRLTYAEWFSLYFDVLAVKKTRFETWGKSNFSEANGSIIRSFNDEINGFPILSRINNLFDDIVFESHEIEQLRTECLGVSALTTNETALSGIGKLLRICDEAQGLELTIYFLAD